MSLYDSFLDSIKDLRSKLKNDRHVNMFASVFLVIILAVLLISNMPLAPKIKREQDDSLEKMSFYIIVTLGVLVAVIYWGLKYV